MKAYEAYRDMLLADYKQMVAERIARESRPPAATARAAQPDERFQPASGDN